MDYELPFKLEIRGIPKSQAFAIVEKTYGLGRWESVGGVCNRQLEEGVSASVVPHDGTEIDRLRAELEQERERVRELEGSLFTIERRLRMDTVPLLNLVNKYGTDKQRRVWKATINSSVIHAQVVLETSEKEGK